MQKFLIIDNQGENPAREVEGDFSAAVDYRPGRNFGGAAHRAYYAALEAAGVEPDTRGERFRVEMIISD